MDRAKETAAGHGAPSPGRAGAAALLAVFAAELVLFCAATARHVSWAYPRWLDQLQYLSEAYDGYDWTRAHGLASGVRHVLAHVAPQGSLHGLLALFVFVIAGPSRTAALSVNILAFIALQAATFFAVRRVSGSAAFGWASMGLLAALHAPWAGGPGSATDFRLDWMGTCAFGVALCAAVAGNGFRSARWAVLFGVAVGLAVLVRHLTAVYFALIYLGLLLWLCRGTDGKARCGRLLLSGFCAAGVCGWALVRARHEIMLYYWGSHVSGAEVALRDSHLGLLAALEWVASQTLFDKVGTFAVLLAAAVGAALYASGRRAWPAGGAAPERRQLVRGAWPVAVAFFAAPACVMTGLNEQAPQTASIIIPGAAWLIILAWLRLSRNAGRTATNAVCAAVALAGAAVFVRAQVANPLSGGLEAEYREVNALGDFLFFRSEEAALTRPLVSATWWLDGVNAGLFEMLGRERHQRQLRFTPMLPTGLPETAPGVVMERLAGSDFVCLVTRATARWPFDHQMAAMLPDMRRWCDGNLKHDGDLDTVEFSVRVYERRALTAPAWGRGVDLAAMLSAAAVGPADSPVGPPAAPVLSDTGAVAWTTRADLHYFVKAAYSPVRYSSGDLPEGLRIDPRTGEIHGRFPYAGNFSATITAGNRMGLSRETLSFRVTSDEWNADIRPPAKASVGVPAQIGFSAFDAKGELNFIDVTDLTTPKLLARLPANQDQTAIWEGGYRATFNEPGTHTVLLRFVRYDPAGAGRYTFVDRECRVEVAP